MAQVSPKVYISYSHDSAEHDEWVRKLAERLRADGVDATLDQWALRPGDHVQQSQEKWVRESEAIIFVLTPRYLARSQNVHTFEGLERNLIKERVETGKDTPQLVPIDRSLGSVRFSPSLLEGRLRLPFRTDEEYESSYSQLLDALLGRLPKAPALGNRRGGERRQRPAVRRRSPVRLQSLHTTHFRALESLELSFRPPSKRGRGQWTLLLGDNGVGKSSLLWAIGLALTSDDLGHGILAGLESPLVRGEDNEANVSIRVGSRSSGIRIGHARRRERIADIIGDSADFPVFAYGSGRGSALGGPDRAVDLDRPLDAVGTLYGLRTSLVHAETWLKGLELEALKDETQRSRHFFDAVCETLLSLLPGVESLEIRTDDILVRGPAVGECPLASLSDGYLTTLGWVVDLIARWSHEARRSDIELTSGFNKQMTGLVLIDEIDLHLHPRWQTHVVSDLRQAFPRMSFVATTHNPLTLLGAEPGELHVMRLEDQQLRIDQVDLPAGIRADQVLTGVWFGLPSTLDAETRKLLETHRNMLRKGVERSNPKRLELEHTLRLRLGSYADTAEDRLAQETAAQHMTEERRDLTDEERSALRNKVLNALQSSK